MKRIVNVTRLFVFIMSTFFFFGIMSNKAYASGLGLMPIQPEIAEKYTGRKFDQWGGLYIPNDEWEDVMNAVTAEYNYMMGYYDKEVDSFLVGFEYEKAVEDFFASKGNSLEVLELESGWDESLMQKYRSTSDFYDGPVKDGKAARKNHNRSGKNQVASSSNSKSIINVTTYKGVDYSAEFNAQYYYDKYPDLQKAIGKEGTKLLEHYVVFGKAEGRKAIK